MKRLIVCCDGTWNNAEQEENGMNSPTNVVKLYHALAQTGEDGISQLSYYHPGVGGDDTGPVGAVLGGAVGVGISKHIRSAYHWLGRHYEEGDEIYLFGFSRGAFTARSLAGMLRGGLLDLRDVPSEKSWKRVKKAYKEGYRVKNAIPDDWAEENWSFFNHRKYTSVHFIGVWETVGALGIPDDLGIFNLLDNKKKWAFHDVKLGEHILHARHAMAIDEMRSSFSICRWEDAQKHKDAKEVWFPGVHSDVGGGYFECDLSDGALKWMVDESSRCGLQFRDGIEKGMRSDALGIMHNSYRGAFARLRSRPRNIPAMIAENHEHFHETARERQEISPIAYPPYHPSKILESGESLTVEIYADKHWNAVPVYFPKNHSFTFSAKGTWKDASDVCDWKGTEDGKFTPGDIMRAASSFLGKFEGLFSKMMHNQSMDFLGTKRVENLKWFCMVGAIANDSGKNDAVHNDGSPVPHTYVDLSSHDTEALNVDNAGGYLYCFANDVWSLYGNNHGSIELTISRVK